MTAPSPRAPTVGLGRFIRESRFEVPSHQRDYSWVQDYVEVFLRDVDDAISSRRQSYFCGLMVFTSESSARYRVLDGQQRLATTLMVFSAVRNWLSGFDQEEFLSLRRQAQNYLGSEELGAVTPEPKLTLTAANNEAFQAYVIRSLPTTEMARALKDRRCNDRSVTLLEAAIYINRYVERKASEFTTSDKAREHFLNLLTYISDSVEIVSFVLERDEAAYTIFETLNDRGLELKPLDLVKNYLFSNAEKHRVGSLPEFEQRWSDMMTLLSSTRADSFLRAFWASRHGKPEGAKLFSAFKKTYAAPGAIYDVSVDMRQGAERYAALFKPTDAIWSRYSVGLRDSVEALGTLGFSQAYSMVLAAFDKFSKHEMERLLWLIECVAVRHQVIGEGRPGRVESLGGKTAKDIFEGKVTTATEVFDQIRELYTPNNEFSVAFEKATGGTGKKIRYLLTGIERQSLQRDGETFPDELTPHAVTVEHIFPRSPSAEWRAGSEADSDWDDSLISRLGNLCLLTGVNQALGNKVWSDKVGAYGKSRLNGTRKLTQYAKWGSAEIVQRQEHMAKLALDHWRFQ